jgi:hypothetical protein
MTHRRGLALLLLALTAAIGCSDPAAPELTGQWGGPDATLSLAPDGGSVVYACGSGTVAAGWRIDPNGKWSGTGQYFTGGGPVPSEGRPPHAASYSGSAHGDLLTFTVSVPDLHTTLGPFIVRRGAPGASEICL